MRNHLAILLLSISSMFSQIAKAQSVHDTSLAFRKLDARTVTGINYRSYVEALADIEFATSEYERLASSQSRQNAEKFRAAVDLHKTTAEAWAEYIRITAGRDNKAAYERIFMQDIMPVFCPDATREAYSDLLQQCLTANWNAAKKIIASVRETKQEVPPSRPATKSKGQR